ncbi:Guanylate cyclase [Seminavis robusta]|uniref:Guanylate cyclase n=1 Tax=Seminavis robusta TaxID=568900 RepID=A0A9N8EW33_9STRA|nr:Guanylate cyclase [Seminavis robusta]|eukprot:Sro1775_g296870.1 Guanylate cyclase (297) ;mRNA; r:18038-18993
MANVGWLVESLALQQGLPVEEVDAVPIGPVQLLTEGGYVPTTPDMPGPYTPLWQTFPAHNLPIYNSNLNTGVFVDPILALIESGEPVFTASVDTFDVEGLRQEGIAKMVEAVGCINTAPWRPPSTPSLTAYRGTMEINPSKGVVVVLDNDCGNLYTYKIDGSDAQCLGRGDLHDVKYDYLKAAVTVESLLDMDSSDQEESTKGQHHYGLRVYPSQELEDAYMTNKPLIFALTLAAVFVLTCATFLLYDYRLSTNRRISRANSSSPYFQNKFVIDSMKSKRPKKRKERFCQCVVGQT